MVSKKQFRSDLYYRLNVFSYRPCLPCETVFRNPTPGGALRETFSEQMGKQIREVPAEVMEALSAIRGPEISANSRISLSEA